MDRQVRIKPLSDFSIPLTNLCSPHPHRQAPQLPLPDFNSSHLSGCVWFIVLFLSAGPFSWLTASFQSSFPACRPLDLGPSRQGGRSSAQAPRPQGPWRSLSPPHAAVSPGLWPGRPLPGQLSRTVLSRLGSQVLSVLQIICGKCSEFKAENGRQSRVCRGCFLMQPVAPTSLSLEVLPVSEHSTEVGGQIL